MDNRIRLVDGVLLDPFNPDPTLFKPENFLHAQCIINRFTGNSVYPYSVAQHSYVLSMLVPQRLRRAALVHDFAETWFNDIASPVKKRLRGYKKYERAAMLVIGKHFGVEWEEFHDLDYWDKNIYMDERKVLMPHAQGHGMGDDLDGINADRVWFIERDWRTQRKISFARWEILFPEFPLDWSKAE